MHQLKHGSYGIRTESPKTRIVSEKGSSYNYKKASHKGKKGGSSYLNTEITALDMNVLYAQNQQKKLNSLKARQQQQQQQFSGMPNKYFTYQQNNGLQSYCSPSTFYPNLDSNIQELMSSELPSLMSVSPYKDSFDMSVFSDELMNVNNGYSRISSSGDMPKSMDPSFTDVNSMSNVIQKFQARGSTNSRKNRMVEMKTVYDGNMNKSFFVISDPMTTNAPTKSTIVPASSKMPIPMKITAKNEGIISNEPLFSRKVFIGGLPIDVTEEEVWTTFAAFGKVLVDWPRRPEHGRGDYFDTEIQSRRNSRSVSGYVFLVFQNEKSVQALVNNCQTFNDKFYLELSSPTMNEKPVQVRAWKLSDIDYFAQANAPVDHRRTVFIGGVPRPTRAIDLTNCLQEIYGKVSYVGIDIDPELKYPKGAARVTFATAKSFVAAITGRFVHVVHSDATKRVEIKPYVMEDQICDECEGKLCNFNYAQYFCGDSSCLQYYCETCWDRIHYVVCNTRSEHRPMVRTGDQTRVLPRPPHHPPSQSSFNRSSTSPVTFSSTSTAAESSTVLSRTATGSSRSPIGSFTGSSNKFSANSTTAGF